MGTILPRYVDGEPPLGGDEEAVQSGRRRREHAERLVPTLVREGSHVAFIHDQTRGHAYADVHRP